MLLEELKDTDLDMRELAINTVKYQKFKTKAALSKFDYKLTYSTAANYFNLGISYIKTKLRSKAVGKKFYDYIEEALEQHVQPLTPSEDDRRREYNNVYHKKDAHLPVKDVLAEIQTEEKLTEKFEYGVRVKDTVKIFKSREQADFFLEGVLFGGEDMYNARIVSVQNLGD